MPGLLTRGLWVAAITVTLAGCAESVGSGAGAMLSDSSCAGLRNELNTLDRQGAPGLIESKNAGKAKFTPQQEATMARYNQTLDSYLGGGCASEQRYKAAAATPAARKKSAQIQ